MIILLGGNTSSAEAPRRHRRDIGCDQARIGIDSGHHRQTVADLVHGQVENPSLLLDGAGMHLGGMGIDGDRGQALDRGDVPQMLAVFRRIDGEIIVERQQAGRNDAGGNEIFEAWHSLSPRS